MPEPSFRYLRCHVEQGILIAALIPDHLQGDELADAVRQELHTALDHHKTRHVIVDFQNVRFLGSAGFRPLLSLYRRMHAVGGRMVLCNLTQDVEDVFLVTRLVSTSGASTAPFEKAPDRRAAIARLKHILARKEKGILVLTLVDEKIQGDAMAETLREEMLDAVTREGAERVVLDLKAVEFLASAGIRPMLQLHNHLKPKSGRIVLCNLTELVRDVLTTTRLITSGSAVPVPFETAPDVPSAVALLAAP